RARASGQGREPGHAARLGGLRVHDRSGAWPRLPRPARAAAGRARRARGPRLPSSRRTPMSEAWTVHLVYADDRSNKFWRGRTEGSTMYVNYGRVGTGGQTSVKELGSPAAAEAELAKQADGKRRKGYVDTGEAAPAQPVAVEVA